jgi:hypothetical protein
LRKSYKNDLKTSKTYYFKAKKKKSNFLKNTSKQALSIRPVMQTGQYCIAREVGLDLVTWSVIVFQMLVHQI